jgi:hypothetical protein
MLGGGSPEEFVSGLHQALMVAALVAAAGALVCAVTLPARRSARVDSDGEREVVSALR